MNISASVNALRLVYSPRLFYPNITVSTFNDLPVPIPAIDDNEKLPIKVVLLDKDNCFAKPHQNVVWPAYIEKFNSLKSYYGHSHVMIVSNTAGSSDDVSGDLARGLEKSTGLKVVKHQIKKPGCHSEIVSSLIHAGLISSPKEIAVVGDRLMTDVIMANQMGCQSVWVKDGVVSNPSIFCRLEKLLYNFMS